MAADLKVRTIQENEANLKDVLNNRTVRLYITCDVGDESDEDGLDSCVLFRITGRSENLLGLGPDFCYPYEGGPILRGGPAFSTTSAIYIGVAAAAVLGLSGIKFYFDRKKKKRGVCVAL